MRTLAALGVALLIVCSGCSAIVPDDGGQTGATTQSTTAVERTTGTGTQANSSPAAPETDVLGRENGYSHDESIQVNQSDGLSDAELEAYVSRSMARVEQIRGLEFEEMVDVEVISRDEHRRRDAVGGPPESAARAAWNDQVWEALFLVGEDANVSEEFEELRGSNVLGYYDPTTDELVVVSDGDELAIDNATLVHELVHALQDQHFDLTRAKYRGETQDTQLSTDGLVEGEANYVAARYAERCGGRWDCVEGTGGGGGGRGGANLGLFLTIYQPYSDGPAYVDSLVRRGGWAAVTDAHRNPPVTTEQIIHPGARHDPVGLSVRDTARNGWTTFDQGVDGGDTVGEASIFSMFWYQSLHYGIPIVDTGEFFEAESRYDTYNYTSAPSEGWANDRVVPYRRDGEFGYVWVTRWDTERDAREFHDAYRTMLRGHDAERRGLRTWVVPDGPFADAFRVVRDGKRVVVVNGPTVGDLGDIRTR